MPARICSQCRFLVSALPLCALTYSMPIIDYGGFLTTPTLDPRNGQCLCVSAQEHAALTDSCDDTDFILRGTVQIVILNH